MKRLKNIRKKSISMVSNSEKMKALIMRVGDKFKMLDSPSKGFGILRDHLQILVRMVKSHITGNYQSFSASTIFLIIFALVYFITPMDLIPDFIPVLGFSDDVSMVLLITRKLRQDIKKFEEWGKEQAEKD